MILNFSSSISPLFLIQVTVGAGMPVMTALKITIFPIETRIYCYVILENSKKKVMHVIRGGTLPS